METHIWPSRTESEYCFVTYAFWTHHHVVSLNSMKSWAHTGFITCSCAKVPCRKSKIILSAYFNRIVLFELLYCWTSVKGRAHTGFVGAWIPDESMKCVWLSPALNRSSGIWWFEHGDAIEIHDGFILDFYTGLSHVSITLVWALQLMEFCSTALWTQWCNWNTHMQWMIFYVFVIQSFMHKCKFMMVVPQ